MEPMTRRAFLFGMAATAVSLFAPKVELGKVPKDANPVLYSDPVHSNGMFNVFDRALSDDEIYALYTMNFVMLLTSEEMRQLEHDRWYLFASAVSKDRKVWIHPLPEQKGG